MSAHTCVDRVSDQNIEEMRHGVAHLLHKSTKPIIHEIWAPTKGLRWPRVAERGEKRR